MSYHNLSKTMLQSKPKSVQRQSQTEDEQSLQMKRMEGFSVTPHNALQLQRLLGNQAVQRMAVQQKPDSSIQRSGKKAYTDRVSDALGRVNFMESRDALAALMPFAKSEFSAENVECQLMILEYKNPSSKSREEWAHEIQKTFFGASAPAEVNVTKFQIDAVAKKVSREQYTDDLFDDISKTLGTNIGDTTSRVIFSETEAAKVFQEYILQAAYKKTTSFKIKNGLKKGFGAFTSGVSTTMKLLGKSINPLMPH